MSGEVGRLAGELSQAAQVEQRREAVSRLRDGGFASRESLENRGTLGRAAHSKLTVDELNALHAALEDEDRSVRLNAIIVAGDLGDATSIPILARLCEDDDPDIRLAAIVSLGDIGGAESMSVLTRLSSNSNEPAEIRLAALTQLEELAAKRITSGPDRRFDLVGDPTATTKRTSEPDETTEAKAALVQALHSIESDSVADELLQVKAADVRAYLESGIA